MDRNAPTYCCDRCQVPVELLQLVKMGKEYVCRKCYDDAHRVSSVYPEQFRDPAVREEQEAKVDAWIERKFGCDQ